MKREELINIVNELLGERNVSEALNEIIQFLKDKKPTLQTKISRIKSDYETLKEKKINSNISNYDFILEENIFIDRINNEIPNIPESYKNTYNIKNFESWPAIVWELITGKLDKLVWIRITTLLITIFTFIYIYERINGNDILYHFFPTNINSSVTGISIQNTNMNKNNKSEIDSLEFIIDEKISTSLMPLYIKLQNSNEEEAANLGSKIDHIIKLKYYNLYNQKKGYDKDTFSILKNEIINLLNDN